MNIPDPKLKSIDDFNSIKWSTINQIDHKNIVIRFYEYDDSNCWIDILEKWGLKKFIRLIKDLSNKKLINTDVNIYWLTSINLPSTNEYKIFNKYEFTENFVEYRLSWTARVFWFYIWSSSNESPSFNIVLIKDWHFETKK